MTKKNHFLNDINHFRVDGTRANEALGNQILVECALIGTRRKLHHKSTVFVHLEAYHVHHACDHGKFRDDLRSRQHAIEIGVWDATELKHAIARPNRCHFIGNNACHSNREFKHGKRSRRIGCKNNFTDVAILAVNQSRPRSKSTKRF